MQTTQTVSKTDYLSPLCLAGACSGFLAAPVLHVVASLYEMFHTNYIFECLGAGGPDPTMEQLALNMNVTLMLHALLFGLFVLLMSNGKMQFKTLFAVIATVSCSIWLHWIQLQPPDPIPTINLSTYLFNNSTMAVTMTTTSMLSMFFVCFVRALQQYVHLLLSPHKSTATTNNAGTKALL